MKHRWMMLLLPLLLVLSACSGTKEMTMYYKQREISYDGSGLIGSQTVRCPEPVTAKSLADIYFGLEPEDDLCDPFPEDTKRVKSRIEDGILYLTLSESFGTLEGAELSLAMTCITMTFSQLPDVEAVELSVENGFLQEQQSIRLSADDVMTQDDGLGALDVVLTVYRAGDGYLVPEEFRVTAETVEEQAKLAIEQLGIKPEDSTLHETLPKNTEILDLSVEDGLCIVDFSADFYRNRPTDETEERLTIYAIVNTLTELDEVDEVQILIEGESRKEYYMMDLRYNYVRDDAVIGPEAEK